jgi:uncharacterized membrane protein
MLDYIKNLIVSQLGKSVVRKLMVLVSGVLLGIGVDADVVQQFTDSGTQVFLAVILYLIAQAWSVAEKRGAKK